MLDSLRLAKEYDFKSVVRLVNEAYRPIAGNEGWTHESNFINGDRISYSQLNEIFLRINSLVLVGLLNEKIIACVHIEKKKEASYIGMLAVAPVCQGMGIGKEMLLNAERYADLYFNSIKYSMMVVSRRQELINFYLRCGYQKTGIVEDFPVNANVGNPTIQNIQIEKLEKIRVKL